MAASKVPDRSFEEVDPAAPCIARMYDYLLGGFANFESDRRLAVQLARISPDMIDSARSNRAFLRRVVTFLVGELGISQFLDLGSGIPTVGNVHEVAQRLNPDARVVYVDIEPIAISMAGAILVDNPRAIAIRADLTDTDAILTDPRTSTLLNLARPVAVLALSVLHFVADDARLLNTVDRIDMSLPAGSALAISHISVTEADLDRRLVALSRQTPAPGLSRTPEEIRALFDGFEPIPPGVVQVDRWRPEEAIDDEPIAAPLVEMWGGIGIKHATGPAG